MEKRNRAEWQGIIIILKYTLFYRFLMNINIFIIIIKIKLNKQSQTLESKIKHPKEATFGVINIQRRTTQSKFKYTVILL